MKRISRLVAAAALTALAGFTVGCESKRVPAESAKPAAAAGSSEANAEKETGRVDPRTVPQLVKLRAAAGKESKYTNVKAAIYQPEDAKEYTPYSEYGWRDSLEDYEGMGPMPAGWWVYVEPYWIVWDLRDGHRNE